MQPLTVFETHFRVAQVLLKVHRLLRSDAHPNEHQAMLDKIRSAAGYEANEALILLLNDLFLGLVRERADLKSSFFDERNLSLLLRQAIVSACTALDVFFPSLLQAHLSTVIQVRQRNFLPTTGEVRQLFADFRLKLDETFPFMEEDDPAKRWESLTLRVLTHCKDKTLSNVDGISAVLMILGISDPWNRIAERAGLSATVLREQVQTLVKRRNEIVHRGDRSMSEPDAEPQTIDYAWTNAHVNAAQAVALAADELAKLAVGTLNTRVADAVEA